MENASKALIFAASILIGVMLLSFLVYIFGRFGDTAKVTDEKLSQRVIDSFNAKFSSYETGGTHSEDDEFGVTQVGLYGEIGNTKYFSYDDVFKKIGISDDNYKSALISISQRLNKTSDVISAINDAIDVNDRNNNGYLYNGLEAQNSIEIIVDLGDKYTDFRFNKPNGTQQYRYLVIEPNKSVRAKNVYGFNSIENTKEKRVGKFEVTDENTIKVYNMLEELRDTKVISDKNKKYTVYKYYFFGEVFKNEYTDLIDSVRFTLVKDKKFDEIVEN